MKPARAIRFVIGLVAFLAIGWAQTIGLHRGYMCECDCCGESHLTQVDHCHGPHSTAGHEDEDHSTPHHHDEDDGDTHPHAAVVDSLLAMRQNDAAASFDALLMLISTVNVFVYDRLPALRVNAMTDEPPRRSRAGHEWPRRLVQTIALRI